MTNKCEENFDKLFSEREHIDYCFEKGKLKGKDKKIKNLIDQHSVSNKACLDVGPGTGRWLKYLSMSGADLLGAADISSESLKRCETICDKLCKLDLEVDALAWDDNTFDLVLSFEVFEHLVSYKNYISEIIRVSKKGAMVIVSLPNIISLISRLRMVFGLLPVAIASDETHVGFYRKKELKKIFLTFKQTPIFIPTTFSLNPLKPKSRFRIPSNRLMSSFDDTILFYFIVSKQ